MEPREQDAGGSRPSEGGRRQGEEKGDPGEGEGGRSGERPPAWDETKGTWDGDAYQRRFDGLRSQGMDVHGEAAFVAALGPSTVLDAGCGTGRVAIELARRGVVVAGVDRDPSMLATARHHGPGVEWTEADVAALDLGRRFDVVVMAGNVPLFTPAERRAALVAGCARHVAVGGQLVAGFQLGRGYEVEDYDADCAAAGLTLVGRWSTWGRDPWQPDGDYAVSVHAPRG